MIALRSPYKEIVELRGVHHGGPFRGRVRTLEVDLTTCQVMPLCKRLKISCDADDGDFQVIAEKIEDDCSDLPANDNTHTPPASPQVLKSRPAA